VALTQRSSRAFGLFRNALNAESDSDGKGKDLPDDLRADAEFGGSQTASEPSVGPSADMPAGPSPADDTPDDLPPQPRAAPQRQPEHPDPGLIEIHPDLPKVNPNLVFGATMALWSPPRFTAQELLDAVNEILEGTGAVATFDPKMPDAGQRQKFSLLKRRLNGPPSAMLRVNGLFTLVGGGDKAAFIGKALEDRVNPALWSEGVKRLAASRGHVMVADAHGGDLDDPDLKYDRAVAVTVTAAAVAMLTDPLGIIWHPAGNATPPDVIPDFIQSLSEGLAPLPLWLRWHLVPPTAGRYPGAISRGLEALLGMELEMAPNDYTLDKTVGHLFELAARHVRTGKAPGDGQQVGTKDKSWYVCRHHARGAVLGVPVFRLTPVSDYTGG
jgi:hypothetical protein